MAIILKECNDPRNPEWIDVAIFEPDGSKGYKLVQLKDSPVMITLKEWFRDGITDIIENQETGELSMKKTHTSSDDFLELIENKLGANFQIAR